MAGNSLPQQFRELEAASTSYAVQTTRLSDLIVAFENGLNSLTGKIAVKIADNKRKLFLSFERDPPEGWKLWCTDPPNLAMYYLTSAPVDTKIKYVALFPEIVTAMTREFSACQTRIEQASEVVFQLVVQLQESKKESA